jgi:hypothetical protein
VSSFLEAFKAFGGLVKLALSEDGEVVVDLAGARPPSPDPPAAQERAADARPAGRCERTPGCGLPKDHPHEEPCVVVEVDEP